jgi:hypothetical protein
LKKKLFILFLLSYTVLTFAQKAEVKNNPEYDERPVHFGYTLGLNVMDFSFNRKGSPDDTVYADVGKLIPGFQVGMIMDYRLGEYLNFRCLPSFNFGQRNLVYTSIKGDKRTFDYVVKLESSMIDIPLLIKYKAKRINNYRPYLIAGGSFRYDLAPKKTFDYNLNEYVLLKKPDVYYELGFGIDYYLPFFKLSTELKLSEGLLDVLNHTPYKSSQDKPTEQYVKSLNKLNSQIIMFSLHFE